MNKELNISIIGKAGCTDEDFTVAVENILTLIKTSDQGSGLLDDQYIEGSWSFDEEEV